MLTREDFPGARVPTLQQPRVVEVRAGGAAWKNVLKAICAMLWALVPHLRRRGELSPAANRVRSN